MTNNVGIIVSERELGEHSARLNAIEDDLKDIKSHLREIASVLSEAKGGWKTLIAVGGFAGALGAGATKLIGVLFKF